MSRWIVLALALWLAGCASYAERREAERAKERERLDPNKQTQYKPYQPKPQLVPEGEAKGLSSAGEEAGPEDTKVHPVTGEPYVPDMTPLGSEHIETDSKDSPRKGKRCGKGYISSSKTCRGGAYK